VKAERLFADTNLFLRYLTNDVPAQADAVEQVLQQAAAWNRSTNYRGTTFGIGSSQF